MKKCLGSDIPFFDGCPDIKINFNEQLFLNAVKLISDDIMKNYDIQNETIGLLGIARGALPLLTGVAHYTNIRKVSIMQIQMTNTDQVKDYGEVRYINEMIDSSVDKFILLEDIVSYGRCSNYAINRLTNLKKQVLGVYSIIMNEEFKKREYDQKNIDVNYVNLITNKQWVHFFWELGYND